MPGSSARERSIIGIALNEVVMMFDDVQTFSQGQSSALVFDGDGPDVSVSMYWSTSVRSSGQWRVKRPIHLS